MHLAANLRIVKPTANGRNPPVFLWSAINLSPKRNGATFGGQVPSSNRLTEEVRAETNTSPVSLQLAKSGKTQGIP